MITTITESNARDYTILFSEAVSELMNHEKEGYAPATQNTAKTNFAIGSVEVASLTAETYEPNKYYRWDESAEKYVLANEATFDPSVEYLSAPEISSLNQYFSHMQDLGLINTRYTVLPLDEPTFDIDTNTREITVPKHFRDNGISVQGDEIAEVLVFKVPRYFDFKDLDTSEIFIQWRSSTPKEGGFIEGVSVPYFKDVESEPGYLLFGWPITTNITKTAGTISFAVRFYNVDNTANSKKPISYSLSTLTQTVTVQPALDLNIVETAIIKDSSSDVVFEDEQAFIKSRLTNSNLNGGDPANPPEFVINLNPYNNYNVETNKAIAWLEKDNGFRVAPLTVQVLARTVDTGLISYRVVERALDGTTLSDTIEQGFNYIEVESGEAKIDNITYYVEVATNVYTPYTGSLDDWATMTLKPVEGEDNPNFVQLYKRVYEAKLAFEGMYTIIATNTVGGLNSKQTNSYTLWITGPTMPIFDRNIQTKYITPNFENAVENLLSVSVTSEDNITEKDGVTAVDSDFTYQWFKKPLDGSSNFAPINGETNNYIDNSKFVVQEGEEEAELEPGYYYVEVTNNLNMKKELPYEKDSAIVMDTLSNNSNTARITLPAKPVTNLTVNGVTDYHLAEFEYDRIKSSGLKVAFGYDDDSRVITGDEKDDVTYQWYKYVTDYTNKNYTEDQAAANSNTYTKINTDILLEGETNDTFMPPAEYGIYYCVVTNIYNGDHADRTTYFCEVIHNNA